MSWSCRNNDGYIYATNIDQRKKKTRQNERLECTFHPRQDTEANEGKQNGEESKFHVKFIKITNNKNVVEMQQIMVFRLRF
jgi:hypothetical protein